MWGHILRDQLQVDEGAFWACVYDGIKPDRGLPAVPDRALPAELVHLLISRVGLDEAEVASLSKDEAIARLQRFWVEGDWQRMQEQKLERAYAAVVAENPAYPFESSEERSAIRARRSTREARA